MQSNNVDLNSTARAPISPDTPTELAGNGGKTLDPLGETARSGRRVEGWELARGDLVGRYVVISRLGAGGMGVVYAAYDPDLNRRVAIKLLIDERSADSAARDRLLREAQAMAQLAHPNVVTVYDVGTLRDQVWIGMEFVEGQTLTQWLKDSRRKWRETLEVFQLAGQGLLAVHGTGLVHRDFKPDNVMIDKQGRVRVMDFGLARSLGLGSAESIAHSVRSGADSKVLNKTLTEFGTLVGTPRYMAAEQWEQREVDARTDQFSFCVALWEALFGQLPFEGTTLPELVASVTQGILLPPPSSTGVPAWLVVVIRRGLAADPSLRYPSMSELLAALSRDPTARRRRAILTLLLASLVVGFVWRGVLEPPLRTRCALLENGLKGVWDEDRQREVTTAFMGTGLPFAVKASIDVSRQLVMYSQEWRMQADLVCEAAEGGGDSASVQTLSSLCLERRRAELLALVDVLATADAATIENAHASVERLRPPALCTDPSALASEMSAAPLPADRRLAAEVWSLRDQLATVRFLESSGRYDEGVKRIQAIEVDGVKVGDDAVLAEILLQKAILLDRKLMFAEADSVLLAVLVAAERSEHDILRAEAMVFRIELIGHLASRLDTMEYWIDPATALVRRVAPHAVLEGKLLRNVGLMRYRQGNFDGAVELLEKSVRLLAGLLKEGDPILIGTLLELGRTYWRAGRSEDALRVLTRARSLAERELGSEHPILIDIYRNLANADGHNEFLYRRSIEIAAGVFGRDHASAAPAMSNLGIVYRSRGDYARALELFRRAAAISRQSLGDHPSTATPYVNAGDVLIQLGRLEEALDLLTEALGVYDRIYPGGNVDMLSVLINLGDATRRLGQFEKSRDYLYKAKEIARENNSSIELVDLELADTLIELGAADEALKLLEESFRLSVDLGVLFGPHRDWLHAKALWAVSPREHPRALNLAKKAVADLMASLSDAKSAALIRAEIDDIKSWVRERDVGSRVGGRSPH